MRTEPTTGMDPYIRRDIWNMILRLKQGRVIIMTTHSMEEADILSDKVAIIAKGRLRCVGSSVHLKNRFAGYNVHLLAKPEQFGFVTEQVAKLLPDAQKVSEANIENGTLAVYNMPPHMTHQIAPFFAQLEAQPALRDALMDYSLSQTKLEEVFVRVTAESEEEFEQRFIQGVLLTVTRCTLRDPDGAGVGITLRRRKGLLLIRTVRGRPASRSSAVYNDDVLLEVNGADVTGLDPAAAEHALRVGQGREVTLLLGRQPQ